MPYPARTETQATEPAEVTPVFKSRHGHEFFYECQDGCGDFQVVGPFRSREKAERHRAALLRIYGEEVA